MTGLVMWISSQLGFPFLVPLEVVVRQGATEFIELFLFEKQFLTGNAVQVIDILEDNRLFRANFLA